MTMNTNTNSVSFETNAVAQWCKDAFSTWWAALLTILSSALALYLGWVILNWLFFSAVGPGSDSKSCAEAAGACWPFWTEKSRFILFGTYPYDEQWRPALVCAILVGLTILTGQMAVGGRLINMRTLAVLWIGGSVASFVLMGGGVLSLSPVDTNRWNGLPILLILSTIALALALPLGVLLALARYQTRYASLRRAAGCYVEIMRGLPMVTLLFIGVFVLPLTLPKGYSINPISSVLIALVFFHAAYFAEDVRSGLLATPHEQQEAAVSLGLGFWQSARLVLLPQAFERSMPAIVNSAIGAYKDTSLIIVLGMHDLNATARMAFSDVSWGNQALEANVFVGVWFLISCSYLSWIGRRLSERSPKRRR